MQHIIIKEHMLQKLCFRILSCEEYYNGVFSQVLSQVYVLYLTGNYLFQSAMSFSWQWLEELCVLNAMLSMLPQEVKK